MAMKLRLEELSNQIEMMEILLNGEKRKVHWDLSLSELLKHFSLPSERIAIELNREVVRRMDWAKIKVCEGDNLEIIHFVGGG